jgi:hypothetical protein
MPMILGIKKTENNLKQDGQKNISTQDREVKRFGES